MAPSIQDLLEKTRAILDRDRGRFSQMSRPSYKGQTIAPMSSLTQRARQLRSDFSQKPPPLSGKIQRVMGRSNVGITPGDIQRQLQGLGERQRTFGRENILGTLRQRFRESYNPRTEGFKQQGQEDIRSGQREATAKLGDIGRVSGVLEQSGNEQFIKALKAARSQKEARRTGLTGMLEQFGDQKHAQANLASQAEQGKFYQEAGAPQERMDRLEQAMSRLSRQSGDNTSPQSQDLAEREALQALRAYGIDVSKPMDQWDTSRTPQPTYKGQLVAGLTPEIKASHNTLEAVSPKFRGKMYDQRKALTRQLMGDESVGGRALSEAPERMRAEIEALESDAQRRLKKDLASISHRYVQANQFGSRQHLREAEERAQEIAKATLAERNKSLQESTKFGLSMGHQANISDIRQLGLYGDEKQDEFTNVLDSIKGMNKLGSTKWENEQEKNEQLYKDYQAAADWQWPAMRSKVASETKRNLLSQVGGKGISIGELANLNTKYSEIRKDVMARLGQQQAAGQAQRQLKTQQAILDDLNKQVALARQQDQGALAKQQAQAQAWAAEDAHAKQQAAEAAWARQQAAGQTQYQGLNWQPPAAQAASRAQVRAKWQRESQARTQAVAGLTAAQAEARRKGAALAALQGASTPPAYVNRPMSAWEREVVADNARIARLQGK